MKAIIIDDEKRSRAMLDTLIRNYCMDVEVAGMAANAQDGYELIIQHSPDIVFLDVEMPHGDGFSLLERFDEIDFGIIFTTAYDHYAIQAIKHHALDYLLKPINAKDLKDAIGRAKEALSTGYLKERYKELIAAHQLNFMGRISLPIKDGTIYLALADIIRVESDGSYSTFYVAGGLQYVVAKNLKAFEDVLPVEFFRVHKSHMVNLKKVKKYLRTDGHFVEMEDGSLVEISRRKKDEFLSLMNSNE